MTYISATELKEDVSAILNAVYFKNQTKIIKRYGKPIAKIVPVAEGTTEVVSDLKSILNSYFGILPNLSVVSKERKFRKKDHEIFM